MARLYTPNHRRWSDQGLVWPNVEKNEGVRPWLGTEVAPYLPLGFFEEYHRNYHVVGTGKILSLDSLGFLTLSGLRAQIFAVQDHANYRNGAGAGSAIDFAVADGDGIGALTRYDAVDVANGVRSCNGVAVVANEPVIFRFLRSAAGADPTAGAAYNDGVNSDIQTDTFNFEQATSVNVSAPVGVSPYNYYRNQRLVGAGITLRPIGASALYDVWSPLELRFNAHNVQGRVAILCDYVCEYPVIPNRNNVLLEGMAALVAAAANIRAGMFVTYDRESDLALQPTQGGGQTDVGDNFLEGPDLETLALGGGDAAEQRASARIAQYINERVGQIIRYDAAHVQKAHLDRVRSRWDQGAGVDPADPDNSESLTRSDFTDIDRLPGTATAGVPWAQHLADRTHAATGSVLVNLIGR